MDDEDFEDEPRRPARRPGGGHRPPPARRPRSDFRDDSEGDDEDDRVPSRPSQRRPGARRPAPAPRSARQGGGFWRFLGFEPKPARKRAQQGAFDWAGAQDDFEDEEVEYRARRRSPGSRDDDEEDRDRYRDRQPKGRRRLALMDFCTPIFGFASVLPRDGIGGAQPNYQQFRQQVLSELQRLLSEGPEHGIEPEDCREAHYALALFMDDQVAGSDWTHREQWAREPLNIELLGDMEGGVNFYKHLDSLANRQRAVRAVYLVCLSLGFKGEFAGLEPAQQMAKLGEIKQQQLRAIVKTPFDQLEVLFPDAYDEAAPLEDAVPPPPRWWTWVSLSIVAAALLIYALLWWLAGSMSGDAARRLKEISASGSVTVAAEERT